MTNSLKGKGYFIWELRKCEGGDPKKIADKAAAANLGHVLIKIADGERPYNTEPITDLDLVAPVVRALRNVGVDVWGWHYIYGYKPESESKLSVARIIQTGVSGFVVNAEAQFKTRKDDAYRAKVYMQRLRAGLDKNFPIALSTYRRPDYHPSFPFEEFLTYCDYNMPQVYWLYAHDPVVQLDKTIEAYGNLSVKRPMIPTGSAWAQDGWSTYPDDVTRFLSRVKDLYFEACNFWSWQHAEDLPLVWDAISDFKWEKTEQTLPVVGFDLSKVRALVDELQKELAKTN